MKVICAGCMKTGTKSMREALEILGYKNVHDVFEQIAYDSDILIKALISRTASIKDIRSAFENVDAVMDIPANLIWSELIQAFPNAKVILTVRESPEAWLKSVKNMVEIERRDVFWFRHYSICKLLFGNWLCPNSNNYSKLRDVCIKKVTNADGGWKNVSLEVAKEFYINHNDSVKSTCRESNLLVYNVSDGWGPLCKFLNKDIPEISFPRRNVKHSLAKEAVQKTMTYDANMSKIMPNEIRNAVIFYLIVLALIIAVISTLVLKI